VGGIAPSPDFVTKFLMIFSYNGTLVE